MAINIVPHGPLSGNPLDPDDEQNRRIAELMMPQQARPMGVTDTGPAPITGRISPKDEAALQAMANKRKAARNKGIAGLSSPTAATALAKTLGAGLVNYLGNKSGQKQDTVLRKALQETADVDAQKEQAVLDLAAEQETYDRTRQGEIDTLNQRNINSQITDREKVEPEPVTNVQFITDEDGKNSMVYFQGGEMKTVTGVSKQATPSSKTDADAAGAEKEAENLGVLMDDMWANYSLLEQQDSLKKEFNWGDEGSLGTALSNAVIGVDTALNISEFFSTETGSARKAIAGIKPRMLTSIAATSGMSSKQLDSNRELQIHLASMTDIDASIEKNMAAMVRTHTMFGDTENLPASIVEMQRRLESTEEGRAAIQEVEREGASARRKQRMEELREKRKRGG